jgi:hypothetical protein
LSNSKNDIKNSQDKRCAVKQKKAGWLHSRPFDNVNGKNRSAAFDGRAAFLGRTNFDFVTGTQLVGLVTGHGNFVTLNGVNRTSQGRGRGGAYRSNEEKQGTYGTKHFFLHDLSPFYVVDSTSTFSRRRPGRFTIL